MQASLVLCFEFAPVEVVACLDCNIGVTDNSGLTALQSELGDACC